MGLIAYVYRSEPLSIGGRINDCTNGGISAQAKALTLVNVEGPFEPTEERPPALLVKHTPFGDHDGRRLVKIVPAIADGGAWKPAPGWSMFGGNYCSTSDSRFYEKAKKLLGVEFYNGAVPIHDRFE